MCPAGFVRFRGLDAGALKEAFHFVGDAFGVAVGADAFDIIRENVRLVWWLLGLAFAEGFFKPGRYRVEDFRAGLSCGEVVYQAPLEVNHAPLKMDDVAKAQSGVKRQEDAEALRGVSGGEKGIAFGVGQCAARDGFGGGSGDPVRMPWIVFKAVFERKGFPDCG